MNGNFTFHNPTRLHFGENAMKFLKDEYYCLKRSSRVICDLAIDAWRLRTSP